MIEANEQGLWIGTEAMDLSDYLKALSAESYPIDEFRLCRCGCGSDEFSALYDATEGAAWRLCSECESRVAIADSSEYREEDSTRWVCPVCNAETANLGVGFSLYEPGGEIRWLYVGSRCCTCAVLGCFTEWRIGFGPSRHLMDRV